MAGNVYYDPTRMWDYADFCIAQKLVCPQVQQLLMKIYFPLTQSDTVVELKIYDYTLDLDRSELYQWNANTSEWDLIRKKNATIQFNNYIYNDYYIDEWDSDSRWDNTGWDGDVVTFTNFFVKACREDLFIRKFEQNFNKFLSNNRICTCYTNLC